MKRKKLFGIGAVVLMLLVAIIPAIDGMQLNTEKENEKNPLGMGNGDWDLALIMPYYGCRFKTFRSRPPDSIGYDTVEYILIYTVKNVGNEQFDADSISLRFFTEDDKYYRLLSINLEKPLVPGESIYEEIEFELLSSDDPDEDKEKYLAGKKVRIEFTVSYDNNPDNDFAEGFAKFWLDKNEDPDYAPTRTQVCVSAPHSYEKIEHDEIPGLYYPKIFELDLPVILINRLGYVWEAAEYLFQIGADIGAILTLTVTFLGIIKEDVKIVTQWIIDVLECFAKFIHGYDWVFDFIELLVVFKNHDVWGAIGRIITEAIIAGGLIWEKVKDFEKHCNAFYNWMSDEPWAKPIKIVGVVKQVEKNEIVTVSCRDSTTDLPYEGKTVDFFMEVTSEPIPPEKRNLSMHRCVTTVTGTEHKGEVQSLRILSWAFSNGSIYWQFPRPGDPKVKERNTPATAIQFIIDKFKDWLSNRPLFTFMKKLLGKTEISTNPQTSSIERDFDLDALVQRAMEEEKQYEPFEGEYKEYYPGAPRDPNIVYYASDQVIVGFLSYVDVTKINKVLGYPVVDKLVDLNAVIVDIYAIDPEEFIEMAEQLPDVDYAELNYVYQTCWVPNDEYWDDQWGPKAIKCPEAWDKERGDRTTDVVIIDTGCDYNHDEFPWGNNNPVNYDFVNDDDKPMDDCYIEHGTHCAGIVAARHNEIGIAGVSNIFSGLSYIKVLDSDGAGYAINIAKAIVRAAQDKYYTDIISMSLGGYGLSTLVHIACDYAYYFKNTLLVAAAGNDGLPILCFPARYGSVISVGAVNEKLELCDQSDWGYGYGSNHGPHLELVAPGNNILSTLGGNSYGELSGTSMAAPHVAGVAALYYSRSRDWDTYDVWANECRKKLQETAIDLGAPNKDNYYGYGLVNAFDMVKIKSRERSLPRFFSYFPILQQSLIPLLQRLIKNT